MLGAIFLFALSDEQQGPLVTNFRMKSTKFLSAAHQPISPEYCHSIHFYVDIAYSPPCRRPGLSVVYVTKRPGGYDVLFNSMKQQTSQDYEIIIVDELAPYRSTRIRHYARELGIESHIKDIVASKPKTDEWAQTRHAIAKSINTGLLLATGRVVTVVMDFAWAHPKFVERTLKFHDEHPKSFLAHPLIWFAATGNEKIMVEDLRNPTAITIWKESMIVPPSKLDWTKFGGEVKFNSYATRPEDAMQMLSNLEGGKTTESGYEKQPKKPNGDMFWEMAFSSAPYAAFEQVNGVEEWLDKGDDCQEANVRERAAMFGYDLWVDYGSPVEQIEHRSFAQGPDWHRYAKDTNMNEYFPYRDRIWRKEISPVAKNDFNMTLWRELDCPFNMYPRKCKNYVTSPAARL